MQRDGEDVLVSFECDFCIISETLGSSSKLRTWDIRQKLAMLCIRRFNRSIHFGAGRDQLSVRGNAGKILKKVSVSQHCPGTASTFRSLRVRGTSSVATNNDTVVDRSRSLYSATHKQFGTQWGSWGLVSSIKSERQHWRTIIQWHLRTTTIKVSIIECRRLTCVGLPVVSKIHDWLVVEDWYLWRKRPNCQCENHARPTTWRSPIFSSLAPSTINDRISSQAMGQISPDTFCDRRRSPFPTVSRKMDTWI